MILARNDIKSLNHKKNNILVEMAHAQGSKKPWSTYKAINI